MEEQKEKVSLKPVYVLTLISLIVTLLLAVVYGVCNPVIIANAEKTANENRRELLPDADDFTQYEGDLVSSSDGKVSITDCYTANNGAGAVMTINTNSFGGTLTMMVGVDKDGAITGVKVTSHADTPGLGTKNFTDDYLGQYTGLTSDTIVEDVKKESTVDADFTYMSGASVTGEALQEGVYYALQQFSQLGGAN